METKNLTIMFIDLAGYTIRTSRIPRDKFLELLDTYERLVEPLFSEFDGKIVKKIGDAFMAGFESPTNAVLCGIKIQDTLFKYNKHVRKRDKIRVRIAINTGEVHVRNGDIYGEAVNIASRLERIARINDIYFTESVYLSMNKAEIPSMFVGKATLKGIPRKIKVFKVLGEYSKILLTRKQHAKRRKRTTLILSIVFILLLLLVALYFYQASI